MDTTRVDELVAAVDLGSNSFHMIVGRWLGGEFRALERVKERVQLAAGLDERQHLSAASQARALACIRRFGQRLQGVRKVRAVGTSALRDAVNRDDFLIPAARILGCPIEVISGEEEGRLIYLGVAQVIEDEAESRLVVDIGGGSTELVLGHRSAAERVISLPLGCLSVTRRFFADTAHLGNSYAAAQARAQALVEGARGQFAGASWRHVAGSSGTIESVQEVLRLNGWAQDAITRDGIDRLHEHLLACRSPLDVSVSGLRPDRVDIFPGGFAILAGVFRALDIQKMEYADGSLLDGVLYDLLGQRGHVDVRVATVGAMQRRYQVDTHHAARVATLAGALLLEARAGWQMTDERDGQLLSWSAQLHEVGLAVSSSNYQRHGAYLIDHGDMRGFNTPQRRAIALLVRSHRRSVPNVALVAFTLEERERMLRLAILLRLAVILSAGRSDVTLPEVHVAIEAQQIHLALPPGWVGASAQSAALLVEEIVHLERVGYALRIGELQG